VTDVIVYLPPAIVLKIHVKRLRADDVVKHYQISSTNVIIPLDPAIVLKTHMERGRLERLTDVTNKM